MHSLKIGQSLCMVIFAFLILFGKDPDNDFGIRLTGLVGSAICIIAFLTGGMVSPNGIVGIESSLNKKSPSRLDQGSLKSLVDL